MRIASKSINVEKLKNPVSPLNICAINSDTNRKINRYTRRTNYAMISTNGGANVRWGDQIRGRKWAFTPLFRRSPVWIAICHHDIAICTSYTRSPNKGLRTWELQGWRGYWRSRKIWRVLIRIYSLISQTEQVFCAFKHRCPTLEEPLISAPVKLRSDTVIDGCRSIVLKIHNRWEAT